jgi:hypothetical protein
MSNMVWFSLRLQKKENTNINKTLTISQSYTKLDQYVPFLPNQHPMYTTKQSHLDQFVLEYLASTEQSF